MPPELHVVDDITEHPIDGGKVQEPTPRRRKNDYAISHLVRRAGQLGYEVVEFSGFVEELATRSDDQMTALTEARANTERVVEANSNISDALTQMQSAAGAAGDLIGTSVDRIMTAGQHSAEIVDHVIEITDQMDDVLEALKEVKQSNECISDIASTVNLLAINARIEAARAGEAGAGFATIAGAINELAATTTETARTIQKGIEGLHRTLNRLAQGSLNAREKTDQVVEDTRQSNAALEQISQAMNTMLQQAGDTLGQADRVHQATEAFNATFQRIERSVMDTSGRVTAMRDSTMRLVDRTELIVQETVSLGADTEDSAYIARVQKDANRVSTLFEAAIADGRISMRDLFQRRYTPIEGSNPPQVLAPFTALTDRLLPDIQEAALALSDKVVFCAAVNLDGYLPTHNLKFSRPQGKDPCWNMAHCRNRRIFDDRVGLKAGRNTRPFLLQVYRRDMGGGVFKIMKDVSAPIMVQGQHWGGLRLAYLV